MSKSPKANSKTVAVQAHSERIVTRSNVSRVNGTLSVTALKLSANTKQALSVRAASQGRSER